MLTQRNNNQTERVKIETKDMAANFVANVFAWMGIALAITAFTAYYFASNENLINSLFNPETGMTTLGWIVMLSPLGFVLAMGMGFQRFSVGTLTLLFGVFSILMGASLSFILLIYTSASIFQTFAVTAGMFAIMSFVGYTTKTDLTKFGSLMMMGLIGIIIASVVNMFMRSEAFDYIISFIGVLVFTGLTAYDVQKLKRIGAGVQYGSEPARKLVIMGALSLYLDFINLFLFLLRFLGNRR
ncbi:MAG: Bax inhibitor-1/YccA family protein [Bacteroidales bacterium]|nr:Bax inhibitor-1/YccA family protein [Bacteroidales bacterium]